MEVNFVVSSWKIVTASDVFVLHVCTYLVKVVGQKTLESI